MWREAGALDVSWLVFEGKDGDCDGAASCANQKQKDPGETYDIGNGWNCSPFTRDNLRRESRSKGASPCEPRALCDLNWRLAPALSRCETDSTGRKKGYFGGEGGCVGAGTWLSGAGLRRGRETVWPNTMRRRLSAVGLVGFLGARCVAVWSLFLGTSVGRNRRTQLLEIFAGVLLLTGGFLAK